MLSRSKILILLTIWGRLVWAPPEYKVEEQGNNLILITPDGRRILWGDHNLPSERAYEFEIPLSELAEDTIKKTPDRAPTSLPPQNLPSPSPTPFYDVDWDWEEPDEEIVIAPTPSPTPVVVASPTPTPSPVVEFDESDGLILKANRLFHKGRYYEAALYVDEILRKHPTHLRAWLMKGSALYKMGQKDMAQKAWQQAQTLDTEKKVTQGILERYK
ncbi:MAG: hypothetical protein HYR96_07360 [Deltaproteobacteria bacterium]|nr:hypothetical protein [Deltaproteobacteria bacterium]MBI3294202.1 hypothetical protein [Deltaproteobacteria bacterium]